MKKIVIPSDLSENAFNALQYAAELFKYEKSEFYILNAYAHRIYSQEGDLNEGALNGLKKAVHSETLAGLEEVIDRIKKLFSNPKHSFIAVASCGLLVDEVNDLVDKEHADITVMGTRGKTNDRNLTFGSNTLQVMKYIQAPVLCIPENFGFRAPENILLPTNFMLPYQRRELKLVADIARRFYSQIHLLLISKLPVKSIRQRENRLFIEGQFQKISLHFHNIYSLHKEEAIRRSIEEHEIDLLVMVNSRQTYLENMLHESTIDKIGSRPEIPFLVLQNYYRS